METIKCRTVPYKSEVGIPEMDDKYCRAMPSYAPQNYSNMLFSAAPSSAMNYDMDMMECCLMETSSPLGNSLTKRKKQSRDQNAYEKEEDDEYIEMCEYEKDYDMQESE